MFALDTSFMTPTQVTWLEEQLKESSSAWKIAVVHHSLYSSGLVIAETTLSRC